MSAQRFQFPGDVGTPPPIVEPLFVSGEFRLGPNDSNIQRGDREDSGDNEARPTETGSGPAEPTVDPTSLGGTSSIRRSPAAPFDAEEEVRENDGMEVVEPTDGRLGLTNIGDVPADDWAADTGPTKTPESRD